MQHSASSIELAERCGRAWWLRYREGLKPPEIPWLKVKRMRARGEQLPPGAFSKALGTEMHRLAELYLTLPPRKAGRLIDWNDLPGQCLAELVPLLPPAGSVPRRNVEARMSVVVNGVRFRGLIDVLAGALAARGIPEVWDHKTTRDIRAYALLPDAVARRLNQPKRSLRSNLQSCLYVLSRAKRTHAPGGLARWNYTETQRTRRSLPVVQYIPTAHAHTVAAKAALTAQRVEGFKTIEDATPNTLACDQYGGCWYRSEGHCTVRRKWGAVFIQLERDAEEQKNMGKLNFKALGAATAKANEAEETKAKAAVPAKRMSAPPPEPEDTDDDEEEETEEDDAEEEAPRASKRVAKKVGKRKLASAKAAPVEAEEDDEDSEDAPASTPAPSPRETLASAVSVPDHIMQFFKPDASLKGEAKINAMAFAELADHLAESLPRNPERAQALRLLLQTADCARRAVQSEG